MRYIQMVNIRHHLRTIILYLTPHGIVESVRNAKKRKYNEDFISLYHIFLKSDKRKEFSSSERNVRVVSIEGSGYSGSSAVVDLLREYSNTLCIGGISEETTNTEFITNRYEVDFLRLAGGLFEIERYIETNNVFHNDAVLHRFIKMAESFPLFKGEEKARDSFFRFFKAITANISCEMRYPCYNSFLYKKENTPYYIFYLRNNITLPEYRNIAKNFIQEILSLFHSEGKIIVLDQLCNDFCYDVEKYIMYIPNLKIIHVYRDPRDIYEYAKREQVEWISYSSPEDFAVWYGTMVKCFDNVKNSNYYLPIRFRDLIDDYSATVSKIEIFCELSEKSHSNKLQFFNPEISRKNIDVWRNDKGNIHEYDILYSLFPSFCD